MLRDEMFLQIREENACPAQNPTEMRHLIAECYK